jgi:hypothetical protein
MRTMEMMMAKMMMAMIGGAIFLLLAGSMFYCSWKALQWLFSPEKSNS